MRYELQFVPIGFLKNLVLHLERSPSIHSYGYGFSGDSPNCLASFPRNSDSLMRIAGLPNRLQSIDRAPFRQPQRVTLRLDAGSAERLRWRDGRQPVGGWCKPWARVRCRTGVVPVARPELQAEEGIRCLRNEQCPTEQGEPAKSIDTGDRG